MAKRAHLTGVYAIELMGTDHFYIGSSSDIGSRWTAHRYALRSGKHNNPRLRNAWAKYGPSAFRMVVLEECDRSALLEREQAYIDGLQPWFNLAPRAGSPPPASPEFIARLRARMALITVCPKGHSYDESNTYLNAKGKRICRACNAERVSGVYAAETPDQREERRQRVRIYHERTKDATAEQQRAYTASHKEQKRVYDQARAESKREADHNRRAVANLTPEQLEAQRQARRDHYHRDPERTKRLQHEHYIRRRDRMKVTP